MRVLVTWGTVRGGTEGIARIIGDTLKEKGFEVDLVPADRVGRGVVFDAAVVGGGLYANRWVPSARRVVSRLGAKLRRVPVWFFSSGPLDDSADREDPAPPLRIRASMERVGALGHRTFGGRLEAGAQGFPASAMAKEHAGDWRNPEVIRGWALEIARALPTAKPGVAVEPPGGSVGRLLGHGLAGAVVCALTLGVLLRVSTAGIALAAHAVAAPVVFTLVTIPYFRQRGAREALPTAVVFLGLLALLDGVAAAGVFPLAAWTTGTVVGACLPFVLGFLATWITGTMMSTLPWPKPAKGAVARS